MTPLPRGWAWTTLGELTDVVSGVTKGEKRRSDVELMDVPYLRVANVQRGWLNLSEVLTIRASKRDIEELALKPGDILLNEGGDRDKLGRGWLWRGELPLCIHQNHVFRARPRSVDLSSEFISHYANHAGATFFQIQGKQTTNLASISKSKLVQLPIPLPPAAEQRRIVAKLDAIFARSRVVKASLEHVPKIFERLRQAVLAAAFRGDLTAEWRSQQLERGSIVRGTGVTGDARMDGLPHGWHWTSLDQVAEIAGGLTKNSAKRELAPHKVPLVSVAAVHLREIRPDAIGSIGLLSEDGDRGKLQQDDLLLVEGNGSLTHIGRVALWDGSVPEARHQNHLIRLRPFQMSPRYLLEWLASPRGRDAIIREATSAAGLYTLSLAKVGRLPVPVAPPDEQREIVARVSAALDQARSLELLIEQTTVRCVMLESAALMKAFRGELVPQDPNDEPASVLLERIRAEREAPRRVRRNARRKPSG